MKGTKLSSKVEDTRSRAAGGIWGGTVSPGDKGVPAFLADGRAS